MLKKFFLILIVFALGFAFVYFKMQNKDTKKEFVLWTIQLKPVAQDIIEQNIKTFEANHSDYKVVWVDIPIAEAQKRTLASILGGNPPDLVNLNPDFSVILAQKGALEYFSEKDVEKFLPSSVNALKYEGKIFALPFYATSSITLYNKTEFEKCGFDKAPKTYEELVQIAPELKTCSGIYPYAVNLNENDSLAKILNKYDVSSFENQKDIENTTKVFEMFNDLYKNNLISKDTLTINHREMAEKYMSDNALLVVIGSNFLNMVKENAPTIYAQSDISTQLTSKDGKFDAALMNFIIPKRAKNKELAREMADLITSKDSQIALSKMTNVIPLNKEALEDDYFKNCDEELGAKARCISVEQLNNIQDKSFSQKNKKAINDAINSAIETVLLNNLNDEQIESEINKTANKINYLTR